MDTVGTLVEATNRETSAEYHVVFEASPGSAHRHQFLFFVKPELLDTLDETVLRRRWELIMEGLGRFDVSIDRAMLLSGAFLDRHNVIARHYGVIDQVARSPKEYLAETGVERSSVATYPGCA